MSVLSKAYQKLIGPLHVDFGGDPSESILLAGSGRSGTTWLSQLINYRNQYRYLFEPFRPDLVPVPGIPTPNSYIRPGDYRPAEKLAVERILSGSIRNRWSDSFNRKIWVKKRLIKEVRANLYLGWLAEEFPALPIVFIIRHPCAVANSRVKSHRARGTWQPLLDSYLQQRELMEDWLKPLEEFVRDASEKHLFYQMVVTWCIENCVPLRQLDSRACLVFYEDLWRQPEVELRRILLHVGDHFERRALDRVGEASPMRHPDSAIMTGGDPLTAWREQVDPEWIEDGLEILQAFGMDRYYDDFGLPAVRKPPMRTPTP